MGSEVEFRRDLYQGVAANYDRYRLSYPEAMIGDLLQRAGITGDGRLLDLACGTGQLAFPLRQRFSEIWAVDREPDMVQVVRAKADAAEAGNVRPIVVDAETLDAPPNHFELAVIGNAFHRLDRGLVADRLFRWLRPGGCVALCWSYAPHQGGEQWQRALVVMLDGWRAVLGVQGRVPSNWEESRRLRPDNQVLADAGFGMTMHREFAIEHQWTLPELAGFIRSTSFLPSSVLGDQQAAFDADLAAVLGPFAADGALSEIASFACDLARKPGA